MPLADQAPNVQEAQSGKSRVLQDGLHEMLGLLSIDGATLLETCCFVDQQHEPGGLPVEQIHLDRLIEHMGTSCS